MQIEQIRRAHGATPFDPFTLCLTDGQRIPVSRPEYLYIAPGPVRPFVLASEGGTYRVGEAAAPARTGASESHRRQERAMQINAERVRRSRWVHAGPCVVQVEVDAVIPVDDPSEACYEPETVDFLRRVREKAEAGDVECLKRVRKVYERVPGEFRTRARRLGVDGTRERVRTHAGDEE
jgi:hypothetical protein